MLQISNLINDNGNAAANQFVIRKDNKTYFQSYGTAICQIEVNGKVTLSQKWHYGKTTAKHLYMFLRQFGWDVNCQKDVKKLISNGNFSVCELNININFFKL